MSRSSTPSAAPNSPSRTRSRSATPADCELGERHVNEALYRIGISFSREHDLDRLVDLITAEATSLTGADVGAFFFHSSHGVGQPLELVACAGPAAASMDRFAAPRITALFAATHSEREIVRLADVTTDPRFGSMGGLPPGHPRISSYLAVPVVSPGGEILGGLYFGHREPDRFNELHERAIVGIAAQAATAIENARLYEALKASEEEAKRAYERARRADQSKDEFLAMLGHELRNPLAPMVTALEIMRLKGCEWDHERTVIERQVHHLRRLVDDLLDISRVTRGKVELRREILDLREVVAKAIELSTPVLEEKRHAFECVLPDEPLCVDGDQVRLAQVLTNLLTNAAKYTEAGGRVRIEAREIEELVEVRVSDDGVGIADEMLDQVFDLFVQGHRTLDRAQGGLGIGLAIVRNLVEMHGGTVSASSAGLGKGSEFLVRLPAVKDVPSRIEDRAEPTSSPCERARGRRVLVVEDNHDVADLLAEAVMVMGYEARRAHDGPSALKEAPSFRPDVILLDIGLPVMDGYELARRLREIPALQHVTIIAITGYGQERDRIRSRRAGIDAHLVKPVALDQLRTVMDGAIPSPHPAPA